MKTIPLSDVVKFGQYISPTMGRLKTMFPGCESITPLKVLDGPLHKKDKMRVLLLSDGLEIDSVRKAALLFAREVQHLHPLCKTILDAVEQHMEENITDEDLNLVRSEGLLASKAKRNSQYWALWTAISTTYVSRSEAILVSSNALCADYVARHESKELDDPGAYQRAEDKQFEILRSIVQEAEASRPN